MNIYLECLIIGLISAICCIISYNIIYRDDKKKLKYNKSNIILCFIIGFLIHYIIRKNKLTELYCKKVCYGDKCFMSCKYI